MAEPKHENLKAGSLTDIYIAGIAMTRFGRHLERSLEDLACEALKGALTDAGCNKNDIGVAFYSGITNGSLQGQTAIPGQVVLGKIGIEGIPIFNVENACASGSSAVALAIQSLRSGVTDVALAIGAEKMNVADKLSALKLMDGGWDVSRAEESHARLMSLCEGFEPPAGTESDKPYSRFMTVYAALSRHHMQTWGTTHRQIAAVAAKNHQHSVHNPLAQFRMSFSVEDVMTSPPIIYPLTLPMCAPISDGAAAAIICTKEGLSRIGGDRSRCIKVAASVIRSATSRDIGAYDRNLSRLAANQAYEIAGLGPKDMNVAEVHDATAMAEILQVENLGFVAVGEGGPAAERGDFTIGGRLPVNPSGGLESKGHPIGATGIGQLFELVSQLRGEAGARQVEGARHAIQENGGGFSGIEEAAVAVHILTK